LLNRESWNRHKRNIIYNAHGAEIHNCKVMKHVNKAEKEMIGVNNISEQN
jgi:hypothetical protein